MTTTNTERIREGVKVFFNLLAPSAIRDNNVHIVREVIDADSNHPGLLNAGVKRMASKKPIKVVRFENHDRNSTLVPASFLSVAD